MIFSIVSLQLRDLNREKKRRKRIKPLAFFFFKKWPRESFHIQEQKSIHSTWNFSHNDKICIREVNTSTLFLINMCEPWLIKWNRRLHHDIVMRILVIFPLVHPRCSHWLSIFIYMYIYLKQEIYYYYFLLLNKSAEMFDWFPFCLILQYHMAWNYRKNEMLRKYYFISLDWYATLRKQIFPKHLSELTLFISEWPRRNIWNKCKESCASKVASSSKE